MKKLFLLSTFAAAVFIFCGCSTPIANNVVPGVTNEVWIATITAESAGITDYNKKCFLSVDGSGAPENYDGEVKAYTENALRFVGYAITADESEADIMVKCRYYVTQHRRMATFYELTAMKDDKVAWRVQTSCGSAIRPFRPFLPGLTAASLPYIGKNQGRAVLNLKKYPQYLSAVMAK